MKYALRAGLLALPLMLGTAVFAQDDVKKKPKGAGKPAAKAEDDKNGNLPPTPKAGKVFMRPGWGQLGLDEKQKSAYEKAYLSGKAKVDALQAQVEKAKDDLDAALEDVLKPAQLKELREFQAAQKKARDEAAAEKKAEAKAKANKKKKMEDKDK